jgi:peptidyl-tRNA hydrolase
MRWLKSRFNKFGELQDKQIESTSEIEIQERRMKMVIIAGLGNPTREYENTRHNIGFMAIDMLADKYNIHVMDCKHKALIGKGIIGTTKVILVKPLTYMNLSGEAIRAVVDYYKVDPTSELIVIYDDISLDVGQLRIRKKGSAGGHNGIKNIIAHLDDDTFLRVKVGVGEKPKGYDLADYVLGHFSKEELEVMRESLEKVDGAVNLMLEDKVDAAMNEYNKKSKGE